MTFNPTVFGVSLTCKVEPNFVLTVLRLLVRLWWVELRSTDFLSYILSLAVSVNLEETIILNTSWSPTTLFTLNRITTVIKYRLDATPLVPLFSTSVPMV